MDYRRQDSINRLLLDGWQDRSVWGYDTGTASLFAQLTRNSTPPEADRPDVWITPPTHPALSQHVHLAAYIAKATGAELPDVLDAMADGQDAAGT
ncbi:hypothetical protein ACFCV3_41680 [Kribbella sp. NPDC056345]|uniref:hypothetical protein n=1 Tax=Kribbella sp. NPDC056345 TaxID=3345789 RepID=UPI0035DDF4CF